MAIPEVPPEAMPRNGETPASAASTSDSWALAAHVSVTGLFALAVLAALYLMRDVAVPVILAWVVANILLPVVAWIERQGLPRVPAAILVTLAFVAVLLAIAALLSLPLTYWLGRANELGDLIRQRLAAMSGPLDVLEEVLAALNQATGGQGGTGLRVEESTNIVHGIVAVLTPAVTQGILFLGALIFYMIYQKEIKTRSVLVFPSREARLTALKILSDIEHKTTVYFGTFTLINTALGCVTALLAYAVGLPNPLLWGVLAAVLNYVPYIGPAITTGVLFLIGLFTFPTVGEAFIAPIAYLVITALEGQFFTPTLLGHRMTLNPFAVFLAIGFWAWMWGPIGAFVAVPILMTTIVTFRHLFPDEGPELPD